jgi:hypothetical protein
MCGSPVGAALFLCVAVDAELGARHVGWFKSSQVLYRTPNPKEMPGP